VTNPLFSLAGKSVLVTGAATGIGRATALFLANHGASVVASGLEGELGRSVETEAMDAPGVHLFP
jgi:NAD(P)-dependent dehydrogenase (short-subunit alcohol dehydrogenase family)